MKQSIIGTLTEDPRWQKLGDLLGLDGWCGGLWVGKPTPEQIISHVEYIASDRARLLLERVEMRFKDAGL